MPAPPRERFIPAFVSVSARRGVTVSVDRQPNLCRWAVHTEDAAGKPLTLAGPRPGQASNPSNTELAAQIGDAVASAGVEAGLVYAAEWSTAELLRSKTSLSVSELAPPPEALISVREAIAAVEQRMVRNLTLACDASRGKGRNINGCGWILAYSNGADPVVGAYTSVSERGGIRAGELAAIRRGLQTTLNLHPILRKGRGNITVLTDSQAALELLARVRDDADLSGEDSDSIEECRRINGTARGINLSFEWVRGHDGHPLNEMADRLAVLARRNRESNVDEVTHARMVAGIREDARAVCASL